MKDMKLICNRIQESKTPGPTARLLSELVEEPPEKSAAKSIPAASSDAIPLVLPVSYLLYFTVSTCGSSLNSSAYVGRNHCFGKVLSSS